MGIAVTTGTYFRTNWGEDTIGADAAGIDALFFPRVCRGGGCDSNSRLTVNLAAGTASLDTGSGAPEALTIGDAVVIEQVWAPRYVPSLIRGDERENHLIGNSLADTFYGGGGRDSLFGDWGNDTLNGGSEDDYLAGAYHDDTIRGGLGDDLGGGRRGNDRIYGGPGNDTVRGGVDNDDLFGGVGNDAVHAARGADMLLGSSGSDWLDASDGEADEVIDCGEGIKTLSSTTWVWTPNRSTARY